jgi:signal peptidase II
MEKRSSANARIFWRVVAGVVALDVVTKLLALRYLTEYVPIAVLDQDWLRLTLVFNRGAAFGLHLGHDLVTRVVFILLTFVALGILWKLLREARDGDSIRVLAISLVFAGAVGNLIDRLRWSRGVVDFLDMGVGATRWPTFNVADMVVTGGAVALAILLWKEDRTDDRTLTASHAQTPAMGDTQRETAL